MVAGFKNRTAALPELDQFIEEAYFNKENIRAEYIISGAAKKDDRVDSSLSKELSEELNGKFIEVNHEGHFLGKEGYDTFELLRDEIFKRNNLKSCLLVLKTRRQLFYKFLYSSLRLLLKIGISART